MNNFRKLPILQMTNFTLLTLVCYTPQVHHERAFFALCRSRIMTGASEHELTLMGLCNDFVEVHRRLAQLESLLPWEELPAPPAKRQCVTQVAVPEPIARPPPEPAEATAPAATAATAAPAAAEPATDAPVEELTEPIVQHWSDQYEAAYVVTPSTGAREWSTEDLCCLSSQTGPGCLSSQTTIEEELN